MKLLFKYQNTMINGYKLGVMRGGIWFYTYRSVRIMAR